VGYLILLLPAAGMSGVVWLPFVIHAETSMLVVMAEPAESREKFGVRLGIYTGFVLTLLPLPWLAVHVMGVEFREVIIYGIVIPSVWGIVSWGLLVLVCWLGRKSGKLLAVASVAVLLVGVSALFLLGNDELPTVAFFVGPILLTLMSIPAWAIFSYGLMAYYVLSRSEAGRPWQFSIRRLLLITTWVSLLLAAWRVSIDWTTRWPYEGERSMIEQRPSR